MYVAHSQDAFVSSKQHEFGIPVSEILRMNEFALPVTDVPQYDAAGNRFAVGERFFRETERDLKSLLHRPPVAFRVLVGRAAFVICLGHLDSLRCEKSFLLVTMISIIGDEELVRSGHERSAGRDHATEGGQLETIACVHIPVLPLLPPLYAGGEHEYTLF